MDSTGSFPAFCSQVTARNYVASPSVVVQGQASSYLLETDIAGDGSMLLLTQPNGPSPAVQSLKITPDGGSIDLPPQCTQIAPAGGAAQHTMVTLPGARSFTWWASAETAGGLIQDHLQLFSYQDSSAPIQQCYDLAPQTDSLPPVHTFLGQVYARQLQLFSYQFALQATGDGQLIDLGAAPAGLAPGMYSIHTELTEGVEGFVFAPSCVGRFDGTRWYAGASMFGNDGIHFASLSVAADTGNLTFANHSGGTMHGGNVVACRIGAVAA